MTDANLALLLSLARVELDAAAVEKVRKSCSGPVDWEELPNTAGIHGLAGLASQHLSRPEISELVPQACRDRLREYALISAGFSIRMVAQYRKLQELFNQNGIKALILKGAAFAELIYPGQGMRPISDVDVLIRESDWTAVRKLMLESGYEAASKDFVSQPPKLTQYDVRAHLQFTNRAGALIEFQFDLLTLGIGMRSIDEIWQRSVPMKLDGASAWTISPEDHLIHSCVHANRHGFRRLKWMVDIAEILRKYPQMDWGYIEHSVRLEGVECCVYYGLRSVAVLLPGVVLNEGAMARIMPGPLRRRVWEKVWPKEDLMEFKGRDNDVIVFGWYDPLRFWNLVNFVLTDRIFDKLHFQLRWFMPPLWWLAEFYDKPKSLALMRYYISRPVSALTGRRQHDGDH